MDTDWLHEKEKFSKKVAHTDDLIQMEVFARLFQKAAGAWGRAPSRARRREISPTPFLVLFAATCPKRTERVFSMLHVLILYPLFSLTPQAQRKKLGKKETPRKFRACGRDEGSALDPRPF